MTREREPRAGTVAWAAEYTGLSIQHIRHLTKQGVLDEEPVYGKVRLVTVASVEKLKKEREAKSRG
jgi:hypothetical protein